MEPRISVLIPARQGTAHVVPAVEQVRRQRHAAHEILVLYHPSFQPALLARMQKPWPPSLVRWITVASDSPGALRNTGVAAASGEAILFLEAGETLDPGYLEAVAKRLTSRPDIAFVASWFWGPNAAGLHTLTKPTLDLEGILGSDGLVPGPAVFRRSAWETAGRFDESLPSSEWYEFWIRLLARHCRGEVIEEALVGHEPARDSAYRRSLDKDRHVAGMRLVFEKHLPLFRRQIAPALCDRERSLKTLGARYGQLLRRRDGLVPERVALRERLEQTVGQLRAMNQGSLDWGDLRRVLPLSPDWGYERGSPIDRYYIERFLDSRAGDVQGVVLEVQEPEYTRRFGGDRVTRSDVVDINADNARANLVGDLRRLEGVPSDTYDCFILTQTMHVIDDMRAVLREARRLLKPGGVLLVTLPCASRVCLEYGRDGDFWRVTEGGARWLFSEFFPSSHLEIQSFGNVLTNVAFLQGLASHEVSPEEFEFHDPFHPTLVSVRAVKPGGGSRVVSARASPPSGAILLYHRIAETPLDVHGLRVTPADFRAQMTHLAKAYRPVPLIQLAAAVREGWLPDRAVAVTFDDGYADNLEIASPILLDLGMPATFFITSDGIRGRQAFWWDILAGIFFGPSPLPERLAIDWEGETRSLPTATAEARERAHWDLYHLIRRVGHVERDRLIDRLQEWAGVAAPEGSGRLMNVAELEELARRPGHSIGGHGTHHLSFAALPHDVIRRDVEENRTLLELSIGRLVTSFAYPFGDHDDQSVELVHDVGYQAAVTCVEGGVRPGTDPLRLPRLTVGPPHARPFEERLLSLLAGGAGRSS